MRSGSGIRRCTRRGHPGNPAGRAGGTQVFLQTKGQQRQPLPAIPRPSRTPRRSQSPRHLLTGVAAHPHNESPQPAASGPITLVGRAHAIFGTMQSLVCGDCVHLRLGVSVGLRVDGNNDGTFTDACPALAISDHADSSERIEKGWPQ